LLDFLKKLVDRYLIYKQIKRSKQETSIHLVQT